MNSTQLRIAYSLWRESGCGHSFKNFYEKVKDEWDTFIESVNQNDFSVEAYMDDRYFEHGGLFYDRNDWVRTIEDEVEDIDLASWCDYFEDYTSESNTVYIDRDQLNYSSRAINRCNLYRYDGEYYDDQALDRHQLVIMYDGNIMPIDSAYYWDSDNEYHYEPEECESYTRSYHNNTQQAKVIFSKVPQFFIGIEVEKEDRHVKESIGIDDFENTCLGYRKEQDGSLDDESGFEIITPPYELKPDKIMEHIRSNPTLVEHFNADVSYSCGGHMNLSEEGLSGDELFAKLKGYTPLFHALYHKRINNRWAKGKSNYDLQREKEKYQSIRIHSNRIEYRLISAVHNLDTLEWRLKLFEIITKNPASCPKVAYFFFHTKLKRHIKKMYPKNFEELNKRVIAMTYEYENINL
jgi:hypothetical protein